MKTEYIEKGFTVVGEQLDRESANYMKLINYLKSLPKEFVMSILLIAPRFILLLNKILHAKEHDAGLKLMLVGMIVTIAALLGFVVFDMSSLIIFLAVAGGVGYVTAAVSIIFGALIVVLKSALIALIIMVAMFLCNMVFTSDELLELSIELFGEEEGKSFMEKYDDIVRKSTSHIMPYVAPIRKFFMKIGRKQEKNNKKFDFSKLTAKIEKRIVKDNL